MKRKILCLFIVLTVLVYMTAGCGKKSESTSSEGMAVASDSFRANGIAKPESDGKTMADQKADNTSMTENEIAGIMGNGAEGGNASNALLSRHKIIRNANVTIQVKNFDFTYGKIQTLVEHSGYGYIQQSRVSKESSQTKSGMVVVRVQADKFSDILSNIKGLGEVIDASENTEDVTEKFYDVESELRLLRYEQNRLEQYLNKLTKPDDIFKTESRLTEIRHQIESLTGTLNKLSDLVKFSTIIININEKEPGSDNDGAGGKSYWSKLANGFGDSFKGVRNFFASLVLFLAQALPVLIILVLFSWLAFLLYKRFLRGIRKNRTSDDSVKVKKKEESDEV
ncbi:MAG: DUF4349 domain-containing protein [Clostridia bacterium]|nr:DUF4349 domain-containing protein [Clostridia bacterium]